MREHTGGTRGRGLPARVAALGDLLRRARFGTPMSFLLQLGVTAYAYHQLLDAAPGQLPQLWGTGAVLVISFSFAWQSPIPSPDALFIGNLVAQFAAFEAGVWLATGSPGDVQVFLATVVQAVIVAVIYRYFTRHRGWAPRTPADLGLLLVASFVGSAISTPLGAWPGLGPDEMSSPLALWWIVRGGADMAMGALPVLLICHSRAGGHLKVPWPLFQTLLLPYLALATLAMFHWPDLPLAWLVVLCATWAGLALTPRLAGGFALACSGVTAVVGALAGRPWHDARAPGVGLVVDMLSLTCVLIAILLPLVRAQRARMGARVVAQEALLTTVFGSMGDGVLVYDPDGSLTIVNERAEELLGGPIPRTPGALLHEHFNLTEVDGSPLRFDDQTIRQVAITGERVELDVAVGTSKPGSPRFLRLSVNRFAADDAKLVVLITDITERRVRQRELMKFAGRVAHDLRSPMTSAQAWLETVQDAVADGDHDVAQRNADRADQALKRLNQVVEGWLIYTISRDGALETSVCHVHKLASELVRTMAPADAGPEFAIDAPHSVIGDETLVRELLANLIGNAVKYGAVEGDEPIEVSTRRVGDMVEVTVRDHGPGIAAGDETTVFEEFHRGANVSEDVRGSGMGLATCKMIVERHGGTIRAERACGGGARIAFTLPAA